jgi:hypothetical protein
MEKDVPSKGTGDGGGKKLIAFLIMLVAFGFLTFWIISPILAD